MNEMIDVVADLYQEEVVCFLAARYHTSAWEIVQCFLKQEGTDPGETIPRLTFRLEENEMEILRGLTRVGRT